MKDTKNQKRMEKIAKLATALRKVHEEVRTDVLTKTEEVGLDAELQDMRAALDSMIKMVYYSTREVRNESR